MGRRRRLALVSERRRAFWGPEDGPEHGGRALWRWGGRACVPAVAEALSHAAVPPMEPTAVLRGLSRTSTGAAEGSRPSPRASAPAVLAGCIGRPAY